MNEACIQKKRDEVKALLEVYNRFVLQILEIDQWMVDAKAEIKDALTLQRAELCAVIQNYPDKISTLKHEIYFLECDQYGHSTVLDTSPGIGNHFL